MIETQVPYGINIIANGLTPVVAFAVPWFLLKRLPEERRRRRAGAVLIAGFPVFVGAAALGTYLSGTWYYMDAGTALEPGGYTRYPASYVQLAIRLGAVGLGTCLTLWLIGWAAERFGSDDEPDEQSTADHAAGDGHAG